MKKYIILIFFFQLHFSFAKSNPVGFLKCRHQLYTDIFKTINWKVYNLSYSYCITKNLMIGADLDYQHRTFTIPYTVTKYGEINNSNDHSFVSLTHQSILSLKKIGVSCTFNSNGSGLNLPIGYYISGKLRYFTGIVNNAFDVGTLYSAGYKIYQNASQLDFKYQLNGVLITLNMGKCYYISNHLTIDIGVETGYSFLKYKLTDLTAEEVFGLTAYGLKDKENNFFESPTKTLSIPLEDVVGFYFYNQYKKQIKYPDILHTNNSTSDFQNTHSATRIYITPFIKLGYIF